MNGYPNVRMDDRKHHNRTIYGNAETDYDIIRLVNKNENVTNTINCLECRPSNYYLAIGRMYVGVRVLVLAMMVMMMIATVVQMLDLIW